MAERRMFTARLSELTQAQIAEIAQKSNMTKTQVVTLAIAEMARTQGITVAAPEAASKGQDRPVYIYGLCDPGGANVRYVGKTYDLKTRLATHLYNVNKTEHKMNPCHNWIKLLKEAGARPSMIVLEETTEAAWQEREQDWIARLIDQGADLLNVSAGGLGQPWIKTYQAWDESPTPKE